jgi:hypothetical protein
MDTRTWMTFFAALSMVLAEGGVHASAQQPPWGSVHAPALSDLDTTSVGLASETLHGTQDAKRDITAGLLIELVFSSPPSPESIKRVEVLRSFGITVRFVGDVFTPKLKAYVDGYNATMYEAIEKRLGRDIWQRVERAAEKNLS